MRCGVCYIWCMLCICGAVCCVCGTLCYLRVVCRICCSDMYVVRFVLFVMVRMSDSMPCYVLRYMCWILRVMLYEVWVDVCYVRTL